MALGIGPSVLSRWVKSQRQDGEDAFRENGNRTAAEGEAWRLKQRKKALPAGASFPRNVSRYFARNPK